MNASTLSVEERRNIDSGAWFSSSRSRCADILARHRAPPEGRRAAGARAAPPPRNGAAWRWARCASARVAVGQAVTLTYAEPGVWFGDISLFDGLPRTHDADAHGQTTLLCVRRPDFKELLALHVELYDALLRLNCRRLRLMFDHFEDLNTRPLQARLAKQIILLAKSYGIKQGEELRIGLELAQEDLAQLLGASRQRVNQELKGFEREGAVRVEPTRLVVLSREKLLQIAER